MRVYQGLGRAALTAFTVLALVVFSGAGTFARTGADPVEPRRQSGPQVGQSSPTERQPAEQVEPPVEDPAAAEDPARVERPAEVPVGPPVENTSSTLGLSCPGDRIDFGGRMLVPGRSYTQSIDLGVLAGGTWTLRMERDRAPVGEATGEVLPASCATVSVVPEGDGVSYVAPSGTLIGDGVTIARGDTGEMLIETPVRVQVRVYIPWDVEPDVYRMTLIYTAFAM